MELVDYMSPGTYKGKEPFPYEPINLAPLSDLQYGAPGCDTDRFKRHLDKCLKQDAWFYWLGDAVDHASPSGRRKIRNAEFYDSTLEALEDKAYRDLEGVKKLLAPTVGRTLFVLEGHHRYDFPDGTDTDTLLADYLQCPFLGTSTIYQIRFQRGTGRGATPLQIYAHHGERSSVSPSLITRWMELNLLPNWPTVDIFNIAHCHQAAAVPKEGMVPLFGEHPDIKGKQRILAATGGWLKGYVVGNQRGGRPVGTYVEKAQMPPTSLRGIVFHVTPVHKRDYDYLDITYTI